MSFWGILLLTFKLFRKMKSILPGSKSVTSISSDVAIRTTHMLNIHTITNYKTSYSN